MQDILAWEQGGHRLEWNGYSIFYKTTWQNGMTPQTEDKPVVVLLHGFPTSSWDWAPIWDALADRYHLVTMDFLGFGFTDKPRSIDYSMMAQADLVEAVLTHLSIQRAVLLAHDYGVTVAQELLARHLDAKGQAPALQLEGICFLNGGLFPETHQARPIQKLLNSPLGYVVSMLSSEQIFRKSLKAVFGTQTQPSEAELQGYWRAISRNNGHRIFHKLIKYIDERRQYRQRWVGSLVRAAHQSLDAEGLPLRWINGLDDPVSGAHMLVRLRELVRNPDVVELPGIGHYPQCEAPGAVIDAFNAWLGGR